MVQANPTYDSLLRTRTTVVGAGTIGGNRVCKATGWADSRLPFRKKIRGECGGTGAISAHRREQLLKRVKLLERVFTLRARAGR